MRIQKATTWSSSPARQGKKAQVVRAIPSVDKVVVEGVNVAKRHAKPRRGTMQGGIIDKFMPLPAAAVSLWSATPTAAPPGWASRPKRTSRVGRLECACKCGAEL